MVEVVKYTAAYKQAWDSFVSSSKNGTFLLYRDYMEYHADRFEDHSLLFFRKGRLVGLLPANALQQEIKSHAGLTYGGVVSDSRMKTKTMLTIFEAMLQYYSRQGFERITYKAIPHIYHQAPAEEDLYALYKFGGRLCQREVLSVVAQAGPVAYSKTRRWEAKKAGGSAWCVRQSQDYAGFMQLKSQLLKEKYGAEPVHSASEILTLASSFPGNIKLYVAEKAGAVGAGVIIYETPAVAHCQYIASTELGRANGALNSLFDCLIKNTYAEKPYFDFGASTDVKAATGINEKLLASKESYGARAIVHDHYELTL